MWSSVSIYGNDLLYIYIFLFMSKEGKETFLSDEMLINKIYYIRGHKAMLDRDLAELYDVKPIRLREQVKRNLERFPENFMYQLNDEEVEIMVSQNAIPSKMHLGGYSPYVFTEHGVLMLANVLRSERAIQVSIRLSTHKDILLKLEQLEKKVNAHDGDIQLIFEYLKQLISPAQEERRKIGFNRQEEN